MLRLLIPFLFPLKSNTKTFRLLIFYKLSYIYFILLYPKKSTYISRYNEFKLISLDKLFPRYYSLNSLYPTPYNFNYNSKHFRFFILPKLSIKLFSSVKFIIKFYTSINFKYCKLGSFLKFSPKPYKQFHDKSSTKCFKFYKWLKLSLKNINILFFYNARLFLSKYNSKCFKLYRYLNYFPRYFKSC